jgi:methylenetetrahydrofolate reductase (NADPH)
VPHGRPPAMPPPSGPVTTVAPVSRNFSVICEIEPPTRLDLTRARHQIGMLAPVVDDFLIPDNHLGRATVSSIAVANEVHARSPQHRLPQLAGPLSARLPARLAHRGGLRGRPLSVRRRDKPTAGDRAGGLTVRTMIEEARAVTGRREFAGVESFGIGVASGSAVGSHRGSGRRTSSSCRSASL